MNAKKVTIIILCFVLATLTACGKADPYEGLELYESDTGISLYMEEGFEPYNVEGRTCAWMGDKVVLACEKETFADMDNLGYDGEKMTVEDYAALISQLNELDSKVSKDDYGNTYLLYTENVLAFEFTYYHYYYKGSDGFWGAAFTCRTSDIEEYKDDFQLWASSVKIS